MKIIEPAEAQLSNYEVLSHIRATKQRYKEDAEKRGPAHMVAMKSGNLETVMKELIDYLSATPAGSQTDESISTLLECLARFDFEKVELLQILNHRPKSETELDVILEEMDQRLSDEQVGEVLGLIAKVLGQDEAIDEMET